MSTELTPGPEKDPPLSSTVSRPADQGHHNFLIFITFIEPRGASHGELNQPNPPFQADGPYEVCQGLSRATTWIMHPRHVR